MEKCIDDFIYDANKELNVAPTPCIKKKKLSLMKGNLVSW